jgi:hypothetical protein
MAGDQSESAPAKAAALYISSNDSRAGRRRGLRSACPDWRTCIFVAVSVLFIVLYGAKMWLGSLASLAASVGEFAPSVTTAAYGRRYLDP